MPIVALFLPVPPSANNLFANRKSGGRVISTEYRHWRTLASITLRPFAKLDIEPPYWVIIRANIDRRRDLDNIVKPILDALVSAQVIVGDQWIDRIALERDRSFEGCVVSLGAISK